MMPLGAFVTVSSGCSLNVRNLSKDKKYPVYGGNGVVGTIDNYLVEKNTLIIGRVGANCGCIHKTSQKSFVTDNALIVSLQTSLIEVDYLYYVFKSINFKKMISSTAQPLISGKLIYPLPVRIVSLSSQRKICERLNRLLNVL